MSDSNRQQNEQIIEKEIVAYIDGLNLDELKCMTRKKCRLFLEGKLNMNLSQYKEHIKTVLTPLFSKKQRPNHNHNHHNKVNKENMRLQSCFTTPNKKDTITAMQNPHKPNQQWSCKYCTLLNDSNTRLCQICNKRGRQVLQDIGMTPPAEVNKKRKHAQTKKLRRSDRLQNKQKNIKADSPQRFRNVTMSAKKKCRKQRSQSAVHITSEIIDINAPELEGKYKIIGKIDTGGYATVYKAIDLQRKGKIVAIKRVTSANIKVKLQNHPCIEAKILEQFRNKQFFPILREQLCDINSGSYSLVMDYFAHDCFSDYVCKLTEKQTIQYIFVLLHCIHSLAQEGYVHRDIKPSNFLFDYKNQNYLLIDFGLCQSKTSISKKHEKGVKLSNKYQIKNKHKFRRHSTVPMHSKPKKYKDKTRRVRRSDITKEHTFPLCIRDGTPGFRAPEVILGSNNQSPKIDIFSVGVILASIMFGSNLMFEPSSDYHQLAQFVCIYGLQKVCDTAQELNRNLEVIIRGHKQKRIFMNNTKEAFVTGFEPWNGEESDTFKMSVWVKKRLESGVAIGEGMDRKWSDDLYDLLDKLTEFNPFKRPTPKQALEHKLFACFQ